MIGVPARCPECGAWVEVADVEVVEAAEVPTRTTRLGCGCVFVERWDGYGYSIEVDR